MEIGRVGAVDLGRHLQRHAQPLGDGDSAVGPLLRRHAAEEGQIALWFGAEAVKLLGHAVVDGADPVGERQMGALVVRDRHQRELGPATVDLRQILQIEPPVQGGHRARGAVLEQREMHHVGVEVQDVEAVLVLAHLGQHRQVGGQVRLQRRGIEADRLVAHGDQVGLGLGVGAGEQGDLVAEIDQGVAQMRHHPFGAAIQLRRNRFVEGGDLGDLHRGRS